MGSNQSKKSNLGAIRNSRKSAVRSSWNSISSILPHSNFNKESRPPSENTSKNKDRKNRARRFSTKARMRPQSDENDVELYQNEQNRPPIQQINAHPTSSSSQISDDKMRDVIEETSVKSKARRRTRSNAGIDTKDNDDHDVMHSIDRRLRRRKDEKDGRDVLEISRKGKEKSLSTGNGKMKEDGGKSTSADDMQIDQTDNLESQSASSQIDSQPLFASTSTSGLVDAQVNTEDPLTEETSQQSAATEPTLANATSTDSHNHLRREIERSIGTTRATHRLLAQQAAENTRPSMLSALLSDILGLRGARIGQDGVAPPANTPGNAGTTTNTPRSGGTSVIVQGALVSRTVPAASRQASNNNAEQNDQRAASTSQTNGSATQNTGSPLRVPFGTSINPAEPNVNGEAQAATIEEQASMLVRLLSIATAATAASLLSNPNAARGNVVTTGRDSTSSPEQRPSGAVASVLSRPSSRPISSNGGTFQTAGLSDGSAIPNRSDSLSNSQSSNTRSAWASQTFQSLRSRISSIGNRLRGRSATLGDLGVSTRPSRSASESALNVNSIRRAIANAQRDSQTQNTSPMGPPTQPAAVDGRGEEDQPTLASLSNMLRDAIREGLSNVGRPTSQSHTHRPSSSADETHRRNSVHSPPTSDANDTQSRSRAVHATLEAVREGHLAPGEEGSFNRFLFDLSNDLSVAVRGMPSGVEGEENREHALEVELGQSEAVSGQETLSDPTDESITERRRSDIRDGQLSFFRFFTFPEQRAAQTSSGADSTPSSLLPCIVVGVRSLEANEMPGADTLAGSASQDIVQPLQTAASGDSRDGQEAQQQPSSQHQPSHQRNPTNSSVPTGPRGGLEALMSNAPGSPPISRFLLFVSGGHYPPQHPLFHASNDEASRDLMVLMEFLGAMAAVQVKINNTVTADQIEKSHLRSVNGSLTEIETLTKLNQIMENTSERCLICLEDWQEEGDKRRLLDCGHLFHSACIDQWLTSSNNSCPLCRRQAVAINGAE